MASATDGKMVLIMRWRDDTSMSSGRVLEFEVGVCEWDGGKQTPRGLGHTTALDYIALAARFWSEHPEWASVGEIECRSDQAPSRIEVMRGIVKTADALGRKLAKLREVAGAPASFGANALRFARVIGAEGICYKREGEWRFREVESIERLVDGVVEDFRAKHKAPALASA